MGLGRAPLQVRTGRATDQRVVGEGREEDDVGAGVPADGPQRRRRQRREGLDPRLRRGGGGGGAERMAAAAASEGEGAKG